MTMTCKINKLEKPGKQLKIFHTLFVRSAAFYGHFRADTVTSEWFTRILSSGGSTIKSKTLLIALKELSSAWTFTSLQEKKCVS